MTPPVCSNPGQSLRGTARFEFVDNKHACTTYHTTNTMHPRERVLATDKRMQCTPHHDETQDVSYAARTPVPKDWILRGSGIHGPENPGFAYGRLFWRGSTQNYPRTTPEPPKTSTQNHPRTTQNRPRTTLEPPQNLPRPLELLGMFFLGWGAIPPPSPLSPRFPPSGLLRPL